MALTALRYDAWYCASSGLLAGGGVLVAEIGRPFYVLVALGLVGMPLSRNRQLVQVGRRLLQEDAEREARDGSAGS